MPETEKVDIYSMGNIFYGLLTEKWPFEDTKTDRAQEKIMRGERPPVNESISGSNNPDIQVLLKAMEMCWTHDPQVRATAIEVRDYIKGELDKIGSTSN